jgi:hypothetical protein
MMLARGSGIIIHITLDSVAFAAARVAKKSGATAQFLDSLS